MHEDFLPLAHPLVSTGYSLEPDMMFGWRPTALGRLPIELTYNNSMPAPPNPATQQPHAPVYRGYRPADSYTIHAHLSDETDATYDFDTSDPRLATVAYISKGLDSTGKAVNSGGDLHFDGEFECGNLDAAYQVGKCEYDLYMRSDTNTYGNLHWFYFSVTGNQSKRPVRFNIVNFSRFSRLYSAGMRVSAFSAYRTAHGLASGWEQAGNDVRFSVSKVNKLFEGKPFRPYYQLSFEYSFAVANDIVWFATSVPYTLTRLQQSLRNLAAKPHVVQTLLTKSLSLLEVPLLTITDAQVREAKKKHVLVKPE